MDGRELCALNGGVCGEAGPAKPYPWRGPTGRDAPAEAVPVRLLPQVDHFLFDISILDHRLRLAALLGLHAHRVERAPHG